MECNATKITLIGVNDTRDSVMRWAKSSTSNKTRLSHLARKTNG